MQPKTGHEEYVQGAREGRQAEREKIVRYLRDVALDAPVWSANLQLGLREVASEIEAGKHLEVRSGENEQSKVP